MNEASKWSLFGFFFGIAVMLLILLYVSGNCICVG